MAQTFQAPRIGEGDYIDYTATEDKSAGAPIVIGDNLVTVLTSDIDFSVNPVGSVATRGVFDFVIKSESFTAGDPIYWDVDGDPYNGTASTGAGTADGSMGPFAGWVTEDATGGTDEKVPVLLRSMEDAAAESLALDDLSDVPAGSVLGAMTPGSGIVGTADAAGGNVMKIGPMFKTEMFIDLTGLNSGTTAGDIIGKTLTANCHIGQITAAKNGTIVYGQITCIETPATGDPDVDFYGSVTEATGTQDTAISTLTGESLLLNNGDWTGAVATPIAMTALPDVGYLYMADGGGTAATYSAGQFLIELWGV